MKNALQPYEDRQIQTYSHTLQTRKERCEGVQVIIVRRQEDAGLKPLTDDVLTFRTESWERHLTAKGISPQDYDKVYEAAVQLYNKDIEPKPFGIDHLLRGAEILRQNILGSERFTPAPKVERFNCPSCKGTSLSYKKDGKIEYENKEGKKVAKRCTACYDSKNKEITP